MNAETNTPSVYSIYVTPRTAKRLKEAGYPQEAEHYLWIDRDDGSMTINTLKPGMHFAHRWDVYAAPTFEEVARRLPQYMVITNEYGVRGSVIWKLSRITDKYYDIGYLLGPSATHECAAEAAALLWLALYEAESGAVPDAEDMASTHRPPEARAR